MLIRNTSLNMSRHSCSRDDNFSLLKMKIGTAARIDVKVEASLEQFHGCGPGKSKIQTLVIKDLVANLKGRTILFHGKSFAILKPEKGSSHVFPVTATIRCEKDVLKLVTIGDTVYYWRATLTGNLFQLQAEEAKVSDESKYPFIDID